MPSIKSVIHRCAVVVSFFFRRVCNIVADHPIDARIVHVVSLDAAIQFEFVLQVVADLSEARVVPSDELRPSRCDGMLARIRHFGTNRGMARHRG